jgi:chemotaxis protein MotB
MKNLLAIVVGCSMLAGMLSAGGCVSKDEYDKVVAMNARANERLLKCDDDLRLARAEDERLRGELADRDRTIKAQADQIAVLTGTNNTLTAALAEARRRLNDANGMQVIALPRPLHEALMKFARDNPTLLKYYPESGMVKFESDMTFDPGSVGIKPAAAAALKKLAEILNMPEARPFNVYIAGHTDDMPISKPETKAKYETNWGLSQARALSVVKALFEDKVEQDRMGAIGFSMYHPIAPNASGRKGNVMNRRVEIWIVPNTTLLTAPTGTIPAGRPGVPATPETGD